MAFAALPADAANIITQFLHDGENHTFMQTCRAALRAVRHHPRESCFTVKQGVRDMYLRYRDIHMCVGPEFVYSFQIDQRVSSESHRYRDAEYVYHRDLRRVTLEEVRYVFAFLARIRAVDVHRMRFSANSDDIPDVTLVAAQLPVFPRVMHLDVCRWKHFCALAHFPALRSLRIWLAETGHVSYPAMPELLDLYVANGPYIHVVNDARESSIETFPVWPSVLRIRSNIKIPAGYASLRHVEIGSLTCIPHELAPRLWTISTIPDSFSYFLSSVDRSWCEADNGSAIIKLNHCVALRHFTLRSSESALKRLKFALRPGGCMRAFIVRCASSVEIEHELGALLTRE